MLLNRFRSIAIAAGLTLLAALAAAQITQGSVTYQGRLQQSSQPVSGNFDFQVRVYDAETAGSEIGTVQEFTDVSVSKGHFTLPIAFPLPAYAGPERWLDISVRTSGDASYTALTPRQQVRPSPTALAAYTGLAPFDVGVTVDSSKNAAIIGRADWEGGVGVKGFGAGADETSRTASFYPSGGEFIGLNGVYGLATDDLYNDGYGAVGVAPGISGRGVYGYASSDTGGTSGVYGRSNSTNGYGVYGFSASVSGVNYGVYGTTSSGEGYGGYFRNARTDGVALKAESTSGVAIEAAGTGIIKSSAETKIAVAPGNIVNNSASVDISHMTNGGVALRSTTGLTYVYFPITATSLLHGAEMKVSKLEMNYSTTRDGSAGVPAIIAISLRNSNGSGSYTTLMSSAITRNKTDWSTITLVDATPVAVTGTLNLAIGFETPDAGDWVYIDNIFVTFKQ